LFWQDSSKAWQKSISFRHTFYYYTNQSDYFRLLGIFRHKGTEEVRMDKQANKPKGLGKFIEIGYDV